MKLEILHDTLAQQVYEKASTEDKMRLKVEAFIKDRYANYKEHGGLLTVKDLNYIQPYLNELDLERAVRRFIRRSRWKTRLRLLLIILLVLLAFAALVLYAVRSEQLVKTKERNATILKETLEKERSLNERYQEEKEQREKIEAQAQNTEDLLDMTKDQLAEMAHELEIKNKQLAVAYAALEEENRTIEREKKAVTSSYKRAVQMQEKQEEQLSESEKRQEKLLAEYIAAQAKAALAGNDRKLAFRLAQAAWERNPNSEAAQQVLFYLEKPESSYPYKGLPPNHSSPEEIIRKFKDRYGKLTSEQEREYQLTD